MPFVIVVAVGILVGTSNQSDPVQPWDRWAPGVADPHWRLVASLQAWPAYQTAPPDWDVVVHNGDPVVRAAAAAAIGRSRLREAARRLPALLEDESEVVRNTAFWALLQIRDESIKDPLLSVLATWPQIGSDSRDWHPGVPVGGYGPQMEGIGLPSDVGSLRWNERREWLSRFDRASWAVLAPSSSKATTVWSAVCAERSEWDADEGTNIDFVFEARGGSGSVRAELGWAHWREIEPPSHPWSDERHGFPSLRAIDGASTLELRAATNGQEKLRLTGDPAIRPGVYILQGPVGANPLFFRVRRSAVFERSVAGLVAAAAQDSTAVRRLGEMRVRAAAPALVRGFKEKRPVGTERAEWERLHLIRALSRIESPEAAAAVVPTLLSGSLMTQLDDVIVDLEPDLFAFGDLAAPYVEAYVVGWEEQVRRGHSHALAEVLAWPGFAPGSPFANAVEQLAGFWANAASPDASSRWGFRAAVRVLARVSPDRAVSLIADALHRPSSNAEPFPVDLSTDDLAYRTVLHRVWDVVQNDSTVPVALKSDLAVAAIGEEQPFENVFLSGQELLEWLQRLDKRNPPQSHLDQVIRVARGSLERYSDARSELLLANLELRRGRWSEAIRLASAAVPQLPSDQHTVAHSLLGRAYAASGDAQQALAELRAAPRERAQRADSGWERNLETRPSLPGLRIRYEVTRVQSIAAGAFSVESANRLFFGPDATLAGRLVAVAPSPPRQITSPSSARAVVLLEDGSLAGYDSDRPVPRWRVQPSSRVQRIAAKPETLVAQTEDGVSAYDPDTGRLLWTRRNSALACIDALEALSGVLVASMANPASRASTLTLLDAQNGGTLWATSLTAGLSLCTADLNHVAWTDAAGRVGLVESATGRPWSVPTDWYIDQTGSSVPAALVLSPGSPLIVRHGALIVALERATGHERWRYRWEPPAGCTDRSPSLLVTTNADATYVVAAWDGEDMSRNVKLHEVIWIDATGSVRARMPGPIHPNGASWGIQKARATAEALIVNRGTLDEIWEFGR